MNEINNNVIVIVFITSMFRNVIDNCFECQRTLVHSLYMHNFSIRNNETIIKYHISRYRID